MGGIIFCDSGISLSQKSYIQTCDIGYGIFDENGHGSELIRTIRTIDSSIKMWSIKILDRNKCGTLEGMINALIECLRIKASVICLALSVEDNINNNKQLNNVIEKLLSDNKIIVAALSNGKQYSIPAGLKNVIGVKSNEIMLPQKKIFEKTKNIQCNLSIEDFFGEGLDGYYTKINGNSIACAFMSYHIAVIFDSYSDVDLIKVKRILESETNSALEYYKYFNDNKYRSNLLYDVKCKLLDINQSVSCLNKNDDIFNNMKKKECLTLYLRILKKEGFEININTFLRSYDLKNLDTLSDYFLMQQYKL